MSSSEVYRCSAVDMDDDEKMIVESENGYFTFHVVDCEGTKSLICLMPDDCKRLYHQLTKHIETMNK